MTPKNIILISMIIVLMAAFMAGCSAPAERTVKAGDNATIDYILTSADGKVLDTSYEQVARDAGLYSASKKFQPYTFKVNSGTVIPGFNDAVIGMKVGETKNVTVPPEKGYGMYDPSMVVKANRSELIAANITPQINMTIFSMDYMRSGRITAIDEANDTVYVDLNPVLAGQTLQFQITLRSIA